MSLLDEWDSSGAVYGEPGVSGDLLEEGDADLASPRSSQQTVFALETVERHVSRCRGVVIIYQRLIATMQSRIAAIVAVFSSTC